MTRFHSNQPTAIDHHAPARRGNLRSAALRRRDRRRFLHGVVGSAALLNGLRAVVRRSPAFDDPSARVCAPAPEAAAGSFFKDGSAWTWHAGRHSHAHVEVYATRPSTEGVVRCGSAAITIGIAAPRRTEV